MKVALVNPALSLLPHESWLFRNLTFPMGLGYVAAYLRRGGHTVRIWDPDASRMPLETMWRQLAEFAPDALGLTATTLSIMPAKVLASEAKRRLKCLVLMGGPHPSAVPRSTLLGTPGLDAVIRGEGEIPMLTLADGFDALGRADFGRVPGAAYLEGGEYRENPLPAPIEDLDSLPPPAWDLLDMEAYARIPNMFSGGRLGTIITSRGCPARCTFCAAAGGLGRGFRPRSPERVVDEMEHLARTYGIRHFQVVDDCFCIDGKRAAAFCGLLLKRRLGVTWQAAARVNTLLDDALVAKMRRAGCRMALLGIESGDQRVLDLMKKGATLAQAKDCCARLHRHGIVCCNSFILGAEGETMRSLLATLLFAKRLYGLYNLFNILVPYPGTGVFEKYYKDYDRPDTDWTDWAALLHRRPYPVRHTEVSFAAQEAGVWGGTLLYYLDPVLLLRIVLSGLAAPRAPRSR